MVRDNIDLYTMIDDMQVKLHGCRPLIYVVI